jgi:thioredoxin reductase (NADPH)
MEKFDFAIIGAGGTGLAAGMYSARLGLKTVIFGFSSSGKDLPTGGLITTAHIVENYPGFKSISGVTLARNLEEHTRNYPLTKIKNERVIEVRKKNNCFFLKTNKETYQAKAILFATGRKIRKLDILGSKEFENKGVNYCALCDGPLYKDKAVAVVGGSDSAVSEALVLSMYAKKVFIIYRGDKIRAEPINLDKINMNKKIEVLNNTNITEIKGNKFVEKVILDKPYKGKKELELHGVYVAIGNDPISELAHDIGVKLNNKKEIIIDHMTSSTNVKGVYAAGDVTNKPFKQLIIGVSEGVTAAHSAYEYISEQKLKDCKTA